MAATATREEIEGRVFEALEEFGAESDAINPDADFESLDIDSLDLVELAQIVEDDYGVQLKGGTWRASRPSVRPSTWWYRSSDDAVGRNHRRWRHHAPGRGRPHAA